MSDGDGNSNGTTADTAADAMEEEEEEAVGDGEGEAQPPPTKVPRVEGGAAGSGSPRGSAGGGSAGEEVGGGHGMQVRGRVRMCVSSSIVSLCSCVWVACCPGGYVEGMVLLGRSC